MTPQQAIEILTHHRMILEGKHIYPHSKELTISAINEAVRAMEEINLTKPAPLG